MAPGLGGKQIGELDIVPTGRLFENEVMPDIPEEQYAKFRKDPRYQVEIVWRNVLIFFVLHVLAVVGAYMAVARAMGLTLLFTLVLLFWGGFGVTAGAHRLWAHRTYKARLPLRLFLTFCQTLALQNSLYEWCRDHRLHHKFSETDADPHNARRGFFFAHMGWLMCKKHPEVKEKGKVLDMKDLLEDPCVYYQRKFYIPLILLIWGVFPTAVPVYFWGEDVAVAMLFSVFFRYVFSLHCTWLVNSAAHLYGNKPFDKFINAAENVRVAYAALGEGWHNYHHVFPWDYKTSELGDYSVNLTKMFIDSMAFIGQAYDLKTVSREVILARAARTGDGTHPSANDGNASGASDGDAKAMHPRQRLVVS
ncbi:unnamed protein product [Notodromas monacha]|uniref:Fatty acid desaturase domain-containing protein n=1 Tax=Notodromas monacha TaxID=399045 RepID=A0A7R9BRN4_9CRUS|nr:unnamed protein product [Notodromas monacha]CAG0919367.1 unnamed protein product [Notodromas monacha]